MYERHANKTLKKLYGPFLWMEFNCLKATEPQRGDSLLFTIQFLGVPDMLKWKFLLTKERAKFLISLFMLQKFSFNEVTLTNWRQNES